MLKYKCLVLDHDDTVVQSMKTLSYPFWCLELEQFRPGITMSLQDYVMECYLWGFADMCRNKFGFSEQELVEEYQGWMDYVRTHIPAPYPGMERIISRQKEAGGMLCVVSHSSTENITRDYLAHFGICPDAVYGWDLPEHQRKPSPYPLQHIMQTYGFTPEQLLVVDDLKPAWRMAHSIGVQIAFAAWSKVNIPEVLQEMTRLCDFTFQSPEKLEEFLFN